MRSFIGSWLVRQPPLRTLILGPKAGPVTPAVSVSSAIPMLCVRVESAFGSKAGMAGRRSM